MSTLLKTVSKQTKETLYALSVLMRKAILPQCTKEIKTLLQLKLRTVSCKQRRGKHPAEQNRFHQERQFCNITADDM